MPRGGALAAEQSDDGFMKDWMERVQVFARIGQVILGTCLSSSPLEKQAEVEEPQERAAQFPHTF